MRCQSAFAVALPNRSRACGYEIANPRSAKPPLRPLAPHATRRASNRRTRSPASASVSAHEQPVTPPPITTTSGRPSRDTRVSGSAGSANQ